MGIELAKYGQLIFSEKIQENMWIVKNEEYRERFLKEGVDVPIFTWEEVEILKGSGVTPEAMKKIWLARNIFPDSNIDFIGKGEDHGVSGQIKEESAS
jgi:hypothetical protein